MRLLLISIACVLFFGAIGVGLRTWGLATPYQKFDHAFWSSEAPYSIVRAKTAMEAQRLTQEKSDVILWVDLHETRDHRFLVVSEETVQGQLTEKALGPERWRGPQIPRYDLAELRPFFADSPLLEDLMTQFPNQRFVINIVDNVVDLHFELVKILQTLNPDNRVLIQSDTDVLLRSIKDMKALWLYGTSHADLMRLLSFESVGLLPATPFKGDVFISPLELKGRSVLNAEVLNELRRRKKTIFLGPINGIPDFESAKKANPDGIIFSSMEIFLHLREQKLL